MRSLFLKIFLWFWLAIIALGALLVVVQRQWMTPILPTASVMSAYAAETERLVEAGDRRALARWLYRLNRESEPNFLLLDAQGRTWAGPPLPHPVRERFARGLNSAAGEPVQTSRWIAEPLLVDETELYLLAVRPPRYRLQNAPASVRLLLALGVTGLVAMILAAHLTRPIQAVRQAAQRLAAGNLDARVPALRRRDELAELGADFNAMAERLQQLLHAQRQLLRDVSHELRSPLHRMQVALELARRDAGLAAAGSLDRIEREADRLNELIGQVLALSRLEGGAVAAAPAKFDVAELVRDIVEDARFEAGEERKPHYEGPAQAFWHGDAALIHSAVENVVRNALRHTPSGSAVEVRLQADEAGWVVRVRDHGPGLPEEELQRIFQPFVRVSAARERSAGGYGLGLAIAQHAVRLHGGGIEARNADGGGLEVILRLPAS